MDKIRTGYQHRQAMFIDDDQATNTLHTVVARSVNFADDLCTHTSATEALEELRRTPSEEFPSYLFVDVNMPQMDGHQFMQSLKKMDGYDEQRTQVIFLTGSLDIKDVVRADENDVKHYHWKPLKAEDLLEIKGLSA